MATVRDNYMKAKCEYIREDVNSQKIHKNSHKKKSFCHFKTLLTENSVEECTDQAISVKFLGVNVLISFHMYSFHS